MKNTDIHPEYEVPIRVLEECLEIPLDTASLGKIDIDRDLVEKLYFGLKKYHSENRILPDKNKFRPNLSFVGLGGGVLCERDFDLYRKGDFIPRIGDSGFSLDDLKRALLFSHEVVVEDPVFAHCRKIIARDLKEGIPTYGIIKDNLLQLAELRPLMESRLLRITAFFPEPISDALDQISEFYKDGTLVLGHAVGLTDYRNQAAARHAASALGFDITPGPDNTQWIADYTRLAQDERFEWLYKQSESICYARDDGIPFHPFLPTSFQLDLYRLLVVDTPNAIATRTETIWHLGELQTRCAVIPEAIQISDLIKVHRDVEIFESWRRVVRESLEAARQLARNGFSDPRTFASGLKEREMAWRAEYNRYNRGFLKTITTPNESLAVGAFGAMLGALLTGENPLGAVAGTAGSWGGKILLRALGQFERYEAEQAAASFFMAFTDS